MTSPFPGRVPACLLAVLAALLGTLVTAAPGAAAAEAASARTPLRVSIETLTPSAIPEHGRVTLSGTVTNRSDHTWNNLKAYLLVSSSPITDRAQLADAADSDPAAEVGGRLASEGLYEVLGDLEPGAAVPYQLSVPRQDLGIDGSPGVYWVGVHVLGEDDNGRDSVADGRARTFMPLVPAAAQRAGARTRLSVVVPFKEPVHRGAAGRLFRANRWEHLVGPDGRLDRLLGLGSQSRQPVTWVVDPAVLDAVESIARDNPKLDTGPTTDSSGDGGSTGPSPAPSPSASDDPIDGGDVGSSSEPSPEAQQARAWLDEFRQQAPLHTVMRVPYGDLDVASVLDSRMRATYRRASDLSAQAMARYGASAASAIVDPTTGSLPGKALRRVPTETPVLLSDSAYPDESGPVLRQVDRSPVVLVDRQAGSGGPRPNARFAALALRQRILSEAALHALGPTHGQPLVVSTPQYWNPGRAWSQSAFFDGLSQPWLALVDLPSTVASDRSKEVDPHPPVYSKADRKSDLPLANLLASGRLDETGRSFAALLTLNDTVDDELARIAMLSSSSAARDRPQKSLNQVTSTLDYVRAQMSEVHVEGPPFVMMSSQEGAISIRVVNDLEEPVTVGISAQARGGGLQVSKPDPVKLGPGERTAIRLEARSADIGVHSVTVFATTTDGTPVGGTAQFNVRTSHVSTVIWVIIGAGGAVLFVAIVVRLVRRVRRRQRTPGPLLPRDETPSAADPADPSGPHDRVSP
ncbi:MAG: hypothetical protein HOQ45_08935 [Nocardioidaceae bacterium]|nr:hypothetical protein [Nocardioidaceae bacterium]